MTAPRPWVVIVVLMFVALVQLYGVIGSLPASPGPRELGRLVGTLLLPAVIAALYTWWYRRRSRA